MMHMPKQFIAGVACLCILSGAVYASPEIEEWTANEAGWQIKDFFGGTEYGTLGWQDPLTTHDGSLTVSAVANDVNRLDILYTTDATLLPKIVVDTSQVLFDFYSLGAVPAQLDVYLLGNGYQWFSTVTPTANGWRNGISAPISSSSWYNMQGQIASDFATDMGTISEIGVMISWLDNDSSQFYGLDNFDVDTWDSSVVPEPETWAMLGIAFLSIGFSFRERLDKVVEGLKVRIKG
jgi:hypothetical protein